MSETREKITGYADRLANLLENHKADVSSLIEEVKGDEVDAGMLRRLVAFMRKDAMVREEQEAVFDQYRFLAGLLPTPAEIPAESELGKAAAMFADGMTIRAVAKEMDISVGKAHALKVKAGAFDVHVQMNMDKPAVPEVSRAKDISPSAEVWSFVSATRDAWEAEKIARRDAERERRRVVHAAWVEKNAAIDADPLTPPTALAEKRREIDARRSAT